MSGKQQKGVQSKPSAPIELNNDIVREMMALQKSKIDLERDQIAVSLKELENNGKVADKAIAAQLEDRKNFRQCEITQRKHYYWFAGVVFLGIVAFSFYALYLNKEAIVLDFVKIVVAFAGGYGVGRYRRSRSTTQEESDE